MKKSITAIFVFYLILFYNQANSQNISTPFEQSNGNQASTYAEVLKFYGNLRSSFPNIKVVKKGQTDGNESIYYIGISKGLKDGKVNVLIMNGIHAGEPEGIEACMILARDILTKTANKPGTLSKYFSKINNEKIDYADLLNYVNIYIIPIYNVDGALNRNSSSRADQNGPEEYGFRATAKNYDLNRDFIKMDSKNTEAFVEIFKETKPHLLIDTHTSNGADYPYVVTYIASQKDKLHPIIEEYQTNMFLPKLRTKVAAQGFEPFVYVNAWKNIPDSGFVSFYESPRFSTGYATLFNCLGITLETHMLKPFKDRVEGSYAFLASCLEIAYEDQKQFIVKKDAADKAVLKQEIFPISWQVDSSKYEWLNYKGYKASYKPSSITGQSRLYYDRANPIQTKIKYFNTYKISALVKTPNAYIIRGPYKEVVEKLQKNGVNVSQFENDTLLELTNYRIDSYQTSSRPYEGHYLHYNTKVKSKKEKVLVKKGDYIIKLNQIANRFIVECLEPEAVDSYFNWNMFDEILMRKEGYSNYVFEDTAEKLLQEDATLRAAFEEKKNRDEKFRNDPNAMLDFIHQNGKFAEKSFQLYPVMRLEK